MDWGTAWFSSSIGSASEMVNVAEKYDAQVDKVVAAHSLRIVLLVILIPLFMGVCLGVDFTHVYRSQEASFTPSTFLFLFLIGLVIAKVFDHYYILNAWLLGPLVVIGILSFSGLLNLKLPNWIIYFGQLCIGWSLGSKFSVVAFQLIRLIFVIVTTRFFYRYFEKHSA